MQMRVILICITSTHGAENSVTLADLKPGQSARIAAIDTRIPDIVRLMVLGLIEGATVRFEHAAIGGDPLEISVFGSSISIRKQQATHFQIEADPIRV